MSDLHCSFCGASTQEARVIVAAEGDNTAICDACVRLCVETINAHCFPHSKPATANWPCGSMGEEIAA